MSVDLKQEIALESDALFNDVVRLRRDFHQHPELAYEEHRTSAIVAEYLEGLGIETIRGVARTGVVGLLKGTKETNEKPKRVALRADMDALPMPEKTTHAFPSKFENKMHACGHDAHTASLLGAATLLAKHRDDFSGTVQFLFQPAEEVLPGGAKPMLEAGVFDTPPDAVFGQHCIPQIPAGKIGFCPGPMMAGSDELYFKITGTGGHASAPHRSRDPIVAAVQLITSLQTIISRNFPPASPAVLTIASIHGGSATNIIPNEVTMMGTLRTMDESLREMAHERLREMTEFTAKAMGVTAEVEIRRGYPALVNERDATHFAWQAAKDYLGESNAIAAEPIMGAEDFAYFLQRARGTFWQLGVGNESRGIVHNIHSSHFDIDEEALRTGTGLLTYVVRRFLF
ncbi:MAG: M20 family metallopeptidase [Chloroherpetonaceae bacterium]|nr:M20 family metallopeptidase [Chloroherpetonaceae bacterium]